MELKITIDDQTITIGYGANLHDTWKNAIDEFTNWVERYQTWTPTERASAGLPTNWTWS